MLNRIGMPLAKRVRKEKMLEIRKELKVSLEQETQALMRFSQAD